MCGYDLTGTPTAEGMVTCPECGEHQAAAWPKLPPRNVRCVSISVALTVAPILVASAIPAWEGAWGAAAGVAGFLTIPTVYVALAVSLVVRVIMRWFGVCIASKATDDAAAAAWWSIGLGFALACLYALFASVA